jgi:hypothetical protein
VNDLERDLRELFQDDARRVPAPAAAPEGLRRSARRRQAVFGGLAGFAGLAIVAGVVAGAALVLPVEEGPAPAAETTTETANGITITYPSEWLLLDGAPGEPSELPRLVLVLSPTGTPEAIGCPGQAEDDELTLLMTVEELPLTVDGPAARPWPVVPRPMDLGTTGSGCFPDWEFRQARWTASDRTFEGVVGFAADATEDERTEVLSAFASMTFEPSAEPVTSVVLAQGTAGGEDWQLIATREDLGLGLAVEGHASGTGTVFQDAGAQLQTTDHVFGLGTDAERVIFGSVPEGVVRVNGVEASTADGTTVSTDVLDVPDDIDPDLNAFLLVVDPEMRIDLSGYDASGQVVATGSVGRVRAPPSPSPSAALEDGRHFGYVRSVDPDAGTIEFDLAYFLSGQEANDAYHAAGGTGPVPNDHFVVNDNPMLRTLRLAPDVRLRLLDWNRCCETFFDGDMALFAEAIDQQGDVTDGDLIYRGQSQWWVTVEDGVVTVIEEQYSP